MERIIKRRKSKKNKYVIEVEVSSKTLENIYDALGCYGLNNQIPSLVKLGDKIKKQYRQYNPV